MGTNPQFASLVSQSPYRLRYALTADSKMIKPKERVDGKGILQRFLELHNLFVEGYRYVEAELKGSNSQVIKITIHRQQGRFSIRQGSNEISHFTRVSTSLSYFVCQLATTLSMTLENRIVIPIFSEVRITYKSDAGDRLTTGFTGLEARTSSGVVVSPSPIAVAAKPVPKSKVPVSNRATPRSDASMRYSSLSFTESQKLSDFNPYMQYLGSEMKLAVRFETPETGNTKVLYIHPVKDRSLNRIVYYIGSPGSNVYISRPLSQAFKTVDGLLRALYAEFRWSSKFSADSDGNPSLISAFLVHLSSGPKVSGELEDNE